MAVSVPEIPPRRVAPQKSLSQVLDLALSHAASDGPWIQAGFDRAPTTSLNYGSAGVALGLLHVALRRSDSKVLALADVWAKRALRDMKSELAFNNSEIEITRDLVGESSPYHSASGIHAVTVLLAAAAADTTTMAEALTSFLDAAELPAIGLDLTLGRSATLLGAAILLDAVPAQGNVSMVPLRSYGDHSLEHLWTAIDAKPEIVAADIEYPGIAHGWAGFLYATLQWCDASGTALPAGAERRLAELAALAVPSGRGLDWPWILGRREAVTMPGWCNGACGYVFLWTLAHRLLGDERYLDLAHGAAWRSWDAPDTTVTLCCGLAGRAYALLNLYRHTEDTVWRDRARDLTMRGVREGRVLSEYPHSLYKGEFVLAVLAADLEQPEQATMPFFEPMGYRRWTAALSPRAT